MASVLSSLTTSEAPHAEAADVVTERVAPQVGRAGRRGRGQARWRLLSAVAVLAVLGLWQASSLFLAPLFISTPIHVGQQFWDLLSSGKLPNAFGRSAWEMLAGFGFACLIGIPTGIAIGRVRFLEQMLDPFVAFGTAAPAVAVLPVLEVWFGFGTDARVAFVTVLAVWTMTINSIAGAKNVSRSYGDVAIAFGLKGWKATTKVVLPASMPFILAGMRVALAQAAVGMILGGQEIGQDGLGGLTALFASFDQTASLIAAILSSTGLALLCFWGLRVVQRHRFAWIGATSEHGA